MKKSQTSSQEPSKFSKPPTENPEKRTKRILREDLKRFKTQLIQRKNTIRKKQSPSNTSHNRTLLTKNRHLSKTSINLAQNTSKTLLSTSSYSKNQKNSPKVLKPQPSKAEVKKPILLARIMKRTQKSARQVKKSSHKLRLASAHHREGAKPSLISENPENFPDFLDLHQLDSFRDLAKSRELSHSRTFQDLRS